MIITLILLGVVTFMAIAFMALSKRERGAVTTVTDTASARIDPHPFGLGRLRVEPVQAAFTPNEETIAQAKRISETFEASQKEGKGAYSLDGKMIDMPLLKNAQKVLERAKAK